MVANEGLCQHLLDTAEELLGKQVHLRVCKGCLGSGNMKIGEKETGEVDENGRKKKTAIYAPCDMCKAGTATPKYIMFRDAERFPSAWQQLAGTLRKLAGMRRFSLLSSIVTEGACFTGSCMLRRWWIDVMTYKHQRQNKKRKRRVLNRMIEEGRIKKAEVKWPKVKRQVERKAHSKPQLNRDAHPSELAPLEERLAVFTALHDEGKELTSEELKRRQDALLTEGKGDFLPIRIASSSGLAFFEHIEKGGVYVALRLLGKNNPAAQSVARESSKLRSLIGKDAGTFGGPGGSTWVLFPLEVGPRQLEFLYARADLPWWAVHKIGLVEEALTRRTKEDIAQRYREHRAHIPQRQWSELLARIRGEAAQEYHMLKKRYCRMGRKLAARWHKLLRTYYEVAAAQIATDSQGIRKPHKREEIFQQHMKNAYQRVRAVLEATPQAAVLRELIAPLFAEKPALARTADVIFDAKERRLYVNVNFEEECPPRRAPEECSRLVVAAPSAALRRFTIASADVDGTVHSVRTRTLPKLPTQGKHYTRRQRKLLRQLKEARRQLNKQIDEQFARKKKGEIQRVHQSLFRKRDSLNNEIDSVQTSCGHSLTPASYRQQQKDVIGKLIALVVREATELNARVLFVEPDKNPQQEVEKGPGRTQRAGMERQLRHLPYGIVRSMAKTATAKVGLPQPSFPKQSPLRRRCCRCGWMDPKKIRQEERMVTWEKAMVHCKRCEASVSEDESDARNAIALYAKPLTAKQKKRLAKGGKRGIRKGRRK